MDFPTFRHCSQIPLCPLHLRFCHSQNEPHTLQHVVSFHGRNSLQCHVSSCDMNEQNGVSYPCNTEKNSKSIKLRTLFVHLERPLIQFHRLSFMDVPFHMTVLRRSKPLRILKRSVWRSHRKVLSECGVRIKKAGANRNKTDKVSF